MEVARHRFRLWECLAIPGKVAITIHIINVEPDAVAGMVASTHLRGYLFYLLMGGITPAALVMPNRPARREWHVAGEFRVLAHHIPWLWPDQEIDDQVISFNRHLYRCPVCFPDIHFSTPCMVDQYAIGGALRV